MNTTCPPEDLLRKYLLGDYTEDQGEKIEKHLSECLSCEETLAGFDDTNDSLLRHLPLAAAAMESEQAIEPGWLERLKHGPPTEPTAEQSCHEFDNLAMDEGLESYELCGVLGQGGMGVVYRARHRHLNRPVAIKVVSPKLMSATAVRRRFEREIRILGEMNHPGIVMATDAGRIGDAAYLVMELVDGVDLSRLVRAGGPLAIGQASEVARQIAVALSAAHDAGAIHRDVKPSNVMIDRAGRAKLLDFGLAHLTEIASDHHETSLGRLLGTLDYMAPEQADGGSVHAAADLYGLGATLFFLLTGRPPHGDYRNKPLLQQLKSIANDESPRVSQLRADIPRKLDELVARLLHRDPDSRPSDAVEVAQQLAAWADADAARSLAELIPPTNPPDDEQEVARSLSELLGTVAVDSPPTAITASPPKETSKFATTSASRWRAIPAWLIALGGVAGIIYLGFVLWVETQEGTLRIESEVAEIQVEVLDERERVKNLQIKNGESTTELRAGKYRIAIIGEHDSMSLDRDSILLKRGAEEIVRISQQPRAAAADAPPASPQATDPQATDPFATTEMKRVEKLFEEATRLVAAGDYAAAVAINVKVLEASPFFAPAWLLKGRCLAAMGEMELALEALDGAVNFYGQGSDSFNDAVIDRGKLQLRLRRYFEAVESFTEVIRSQPANPELLYLRGKAHVRFATVPGADAKSQLSSALFSLTRAIQVMPDYADAFAERANVYSMMGNYQAAIRDIEKAIGLSPIQLASYYAQLAFTLLRYADSESEQTEVDVNQQRRRYEQAISAFDKSLGISGGKETVDREFADDVYRPAQVYLGRASARLGIFYQLDDAKSDDLFGAAAADVDRARASDERSYRKGYKVYTANLMVGNVVYLGEPLFDGFGDEETTSGDLGDIDMFGDADAQPTASSSAASQSPAGGNANAEVIYQGDTLPVWQRRFGMETDPSAKIAAATALVALAKPLADPSRLNRLLTVGGELVDAGWGNTDATQLLYEHQKRIYAPRRWPAEFGTIWKLSPAWNSFWQSIDTEIVNLLDGGSVQELTAVICKVIEAGPTAEAKFALLTLAQFPIYEQIVKHPAATAVVMNLSRGNESDLNRACLLVRASYHGKATADQRQQLVEEFAAAGQRLVDQDVGDWGVSSFAVNWIPAAQRIGVEPKLIVRVVLERLVRSEQATLLAQFQSERFSPEYPYSEQQAKTARQKAGPFWDHWIDVTNEWMSAHPGNDQMAAMSAILKSFNFVLRTRREEDDWDVRKTTELLTERLKRHYTGPSAAAHNQLPEEAVHDLLAYIILCEGKIPEFVMREAPANEQTRESLDRFRQVLSANPTYAQYERERDRVQGLLQRAPFQTLKLATTSPPGPAHVDVRDFVDGVSNIHATYRLSRSGGKQQPPPMEPLLLLAIATELTGDDILQNTRINRLLSEPLPGQMFSRHISDALKSPFAVRQVAEMWLRRMHQRSKSDRRLAAQVEVWLPELRATTGE